MARAKQTARSEARRRYRQAAAQSAEPEANELGDAAQPNTIAGKPSARPNDRPKAPAATASARPGFLSAFRSAYHPANIREDLRALPKVVTHWSFLVALLMVLAGAAAKVIQPGYTGTEAAWQLLSLPGSALAPQLVAGFFAPRASYLLGLLIGLEQGIVFILLANTIAVQLGTPIPSDQVGNLFILSFVTGPISGTLFSAAAAWYRRFLQLSSPRRQAPAKGATQKRTTARR